MLERKAAEATMIDAGRPVPIVQALRAAEDQQHPAESSGRAMWRATKKGMRGQFQTWDVIKGYNDRGLVFIACASERDEVRSDEFEKIKSNLVSKLTIGYVQKSRSRMQTWELNFTNG